MRFDLVFGAGKVAAARHAETAREADKRIGHETLGRNRRKRCSSLPVSALERVARGNDSERRVRTQVSEILFDQETIPAGFIDLVDEGFGLGVLRELQVRVDHEVRCVIIVLLDLKSRPVRHDGFLPQPNHRIDVRRHMPGVWRGGCDAGIAPGGFDPLVGERRIVVSVDQIVRHSGMLWILLE